MGMRSAPAQMKMILAKPVTNFKNSSEDQVNLLMGYDVTSGKPLFARMYRGSCSDKSTIPDLLQSIWIIPE